MCNCIMSTVLFFVTLLFQTMAFLGFTVISFGISLVGVLLLRIRSENEGINVTVWSIAGLIVLSHVSEGLFFGYRKSGVKAWIDRKKRRAPNVLEKLPIFIYFVIFCAALSQCYFQHPLHNESLYSPKGTPREDTSSKPRFSMIFLLCMAYVAYIAAGSSDWVVHISQPDIVREKLSFRSVLNCVVCIDLEILGTFLNIFLLGIHAIPIILGFYGFATHYIFLSGLAAMAIAISLKVDQACPQLQCGKTPYAAEFKLFAKSFVLQHVWFPLLIVWFMKKCKVVIFTYELSDSQDFAIYVSLLSITLSKAVRNISVKLSSLAVNDNRVASEPVGGGDNDRIKVPPSSPSPSTPSIHTQYSESEEIITTKFDDSSCSDGGCSYPVGADHENNNKNNNNNMNKMFSKNKMVMDDADDIPSVHLPSAPTFEEINEVQPTTWTSRPARKWPGNDFMGSSYGYAGYSDMV